MAYSLRFLQRVYLPRQVGAFSDSLYLATTRKEAVLDAALTALRRY